MPDLNVRKFRANLGEILIVSSKATFSIQFKEKKAVFKFWVTSAKYIPKTMNALLISQVFNVQIHIQDYRTSTPCCCFHGENLLPALG